MLSYDHYNRQAHASWLTQKLLTHGHGAAMIGTNSSMVLTENCLPQRAASNPVASHSCSLPPDAICRHSYVPLPLPTALVPPLNALRPWASALMPLPSALMQLALTLPDVVFQLAALRLLLGCQK